MIVDTTVALPQREAAKRARKASPTRSFRPDIEGLRAIAVLLVVLYHAKLAFPGGYVGVDVFFVISGFLITRQLVKLASSGDGMSALPKFYAHRMRRLLPASATTLIATVLLARLVAPVLTARSVAVDAMFASFYSLNYRLAANGIDYQHIGDAASPLQHFWSLGVEEQFYFIWPLAIFAVVALFGVKVAKPVLLAGVAGVVAVSAGYAADLTQRNAPFAYFSLPTRAWELGVGALVALSAVALSRVARPVRSVGAIAGVALIVGSAVMYTDATPFPGVAAWVPVVGTALVIAAGCGERVSAERLLADPLMLSIGRLSYSWYLWHWPLLILLPMAAGHDLGVMARLGIVWLSLVVALFSFLFVEEPFRRKQLPNLQWIGLGLAMSGLVVAAAVGVRAITSTTGSGAQATLTQSHTAASTVPASMRAAIAAGAKIEAAPSNLTPSPQDAANSVPNSRGSGCHADFLAVKQGDCAYGDLAAKRTVVLFGDSHMDQWLPAFEQAAKTDHWKVVAWTKSACPPATITVHNSALNRTYTECDQWRAATIKKIGALKPNLVIVSASETVIPASVSPDKVAAATRTTLEELGKVTSAKVEYLHDIPIPGKNSPDCVASNLDDVSNCSYPEKKGYSLPARHAALDAAVKKAGDKALDTKDWFCADGTCPAVVGNVMVYRDDSHMTTQYSRWLTPFVRSILRRA